MENLAFPVIPAAGNQALAQQVGPIRNVLCGYLALTGGFLGVRLDLAGAAIVSSISATIALASGVMAGGVFSSAHGFGRQQAVHMMAAPR
jgi:hypothetical protein